MTKINITYDPSEDESGNQPSDEDDSKLTEQESKEEISSGFHLLFHALKKHPLLIGADPLPRYGRKMFKLFTLSIAVLIFTMGIVAFVYDVGYNTSVYPRELETASTDQATGNNQLSEATANTQSGFLKYLKENEERDGTIGWVLTFFLERKHSFFIYIGMIVLLISFNFTVFKRIRYLWTSYYYQYMIQMDVVNNKETKLLELEKISEQKSVSICTRFVTTLFNSFKIEKSKSLFPQFFKDFYTIEEEKLDAFNDNVNRSAVWIVRLGIFGTLLGVAVAFFELFIAIKSVTFVNGKPVLTQEFLTQLNLALLGNALAVATSLVAHASTLVIEIGIAFFLKDEHNLDWLNRTYGHLLQFKGFTSAPETVESHLASVNLHVEKLSEVVQVVTKRLTKLSQSSNSANSKIMEIDSSIKNFNTDIGESSQLITTFTDSLKNTHSNIEQFTDSSKKAVEASGHFANMYQNLSEKTNSLSTQIKSMSDLLKGLVDSFLNTSSKSLDSVKHSIDSMIKNRNK